MHRDRPCPTDERGRRRFRQRHRGAWRGFRRHVRGRASACRCGDRAVGAGGAAAGVATALGLDRRQTVDALGVVGSMASGIIEYLAEGTWTKRMHAGWAAQSGIRTALLARAGFSGPRTVFEGVHGLFHGFTNTTKGDYSALIGDFGAHWVTETVAFKPYPCGTMTHPYIDCARRLAATGVKAENIN